MKTILHFIPEGEHDAGEATVFFLLLSQLKIKLLLLKQTKDLKCFFINDVVSLSVTGSPLNLRDKRAFSTYRGMCEQHLSGEILLASGYR